MKQSEIQGILESSLQRKISLIARSRSEYESSFELENLDVTLDDGSVIQMILKNVGPDAILPAARESKQEMFFNPLREIQMYRSILSSAAHSTAICYAYEVDKNKNRYWLFIEKIAGLKLSFTGDFSVWLDAVRWLASFHAGLSPQVETVKQKVAVIEYDRSYYQRWCDRAIGFVARTAPASSPAMQQLGSRYGQVIDRLIAMPFTVCHGDCYPSNILVREKNNAHPLCPVDWELTAVGPGLIDLASLTAGKWNFNERDQFTAAYWNTIPLSMRSKWPGITDLNDDLNWCRLHLAVQWLGWSPKWAPPVDQANDWLEEMITLATKLNLL